MSRPVWTGRISFGLVNVPVKAYTAVRDHSIHFHQIDRASGARVRHQNVSAATGDPVERADMVSGYEVATGRYVTFEPDELDALRPPSTKAIEVQDFVALEDVDPIFYERTYWLGPDGDGALAPYRLLHAAMVDRGRVAIGTVVMRTKEYLAAIRPIGGALALSTMRFADEVVAADDVPEVPGEGEAPEARALDLATQIIDSLTADWEPERYTDTMVTRVREAIEAKAEGEVLEVEAPSERGGKVLDLMEALEATVAERRKRA